MKIVQINAVYEYGSTGRSVKELHMSSKKYGFESYVFCANTNIPSQGIYCMGNSITRAIHGVLSRITGLQGCFSFIATMKAIRKIKAINPDVIHLRNLHSNYIHFPLLLRFLAVNDIPTIITLHDCWFYTGHCCHYLSDNCDKWRSECSKCPSIHRWNESWFFDTSKLMFRMKRNLFSNINNLTVVGVSNWILSEAKDSFLKSGSKFSRVYNWIDIDRFSLKKEKKDTGIILSVASRWTKEKGLYDIISVASVCTGYTFRLVGEMPDGVELPFNVVSVGSITDLDQLCQEYQNAEVFLFLSHMETFGKVVVEAMACGTPVIVYDVTAIPELVGPHCGVVVEYPNWKQACDSIDVVKAMEPLDCRRWVESNFSKDKLIQKQIGVYRKAINSQTGINI